MRRLLPGLLVASLIALSTPSRALADPPSGSAAAPARAPSADADGEHPPLGREAAAEADRRAAARDEEQAKAAAAEAERRKAAAAAREKAERKAAENAPDPMPAPPEGPYHGVVLEGKNPPPGPHAPTGRRGKSAGAQLTWLGFRVEEGVPAVFAQLSQPVVWSVEEKAGTLVYTLQSVRVPLGNNRRPLDVSAFGTAIKSVVAAPRGRDVVLTIVGAGGRLSHRERNKDAPDGYKFLVIELPST